MVQLPALNTPQFNWCRAKLPHKPQPVPPIYQPEVAADAIVWAAYHNRREITVGFNNAVILWGNKFFPGVGDWYLAKTGYESQQLDERIDPDRPDNLWEPVEGDYGARGDFDDRAQNDSWQLWVNKNLDLVATAAGLGLAVAAYALFDGD